MINLRKIDKFWLSGGWDKIKDNLTLINGLGIKAILDLQFMEPTNDVRASIEFVRTAANKISLDYKAIIFRDDEFNTDLEAIFTEGDKYLTEMEEKYPKMKDAILVKCGAGISRSSAMLIYHLCNARRMSYVEALNFVRGKEENYYIEYGSSPNPVFVQFLKSKFKDSTYE